MTQLMVLRGKSWSCWNCAPCMRWEFNKSALIRLVRSQKANQCFEQILFPSSCASAVCAAKTHLLPVSLCLNKGFSLAEWGCEHHTALALWLSWHRHVQQPSVPGCWPGIREMETAACSLLGIKENMLRTVCPHIHGSIWSRTQCFNFKPTLRWSP